MNFNYAGYFERRTDLCGGELVVKGTRVPVRTLLASLAEGATEAEILADFPTVTRVGLRAVIAFAAHEAMEDAGDLADVLAVLENPGKPISMAEMREKYSL
jgi:uncharacterized protein (DUF433 family)